MEVVSGPVGKEHVYFQAPPADRLDQEMQAFIQWFNSGADIDPVLKAGLAHFWFVTIHPFDDGNGRIARAIADMALALSDNSPQRFYSLSAQIRQEREAYYNILEETQKGPLDITPWMEWFLSCRGRAIDGANYTRLNSGEGALVGSGILIRNPEGGRSTSYALANPKMLDNRRISR